jgi:MFS transporter, AAHS family, 4-hydroxybenzoate transporter
MQAIQASAISASSTRFRVACLCAAVLLVKGYDIAAVGYVLPLLVDAWRVTPAAFTPALAAGNIGLLLGSLIAGLLGDRFGRKPVMIACVSAFGILSLVSAFVASPTQLAMVRVLRARTLETVVAAVGELLGAYSAKECANYFVNAGYGQV